MSDINVSIQQTEVKSVEYRNDYAITPGVKINLEVRTKAGVLLNMETPLSAVVEVTFIVADKENDRVYFEMHTYTPVTVSSFIDNLDKVIEEKYLGSIMLAVNEKIKVISSSVGLNIRIPATAFPYNS